ncbi:hypothetical protein KM043_002653 [Ampulex compressa]|nr:hypothetical protein KM043_002653 [Ampulex compressa]
MPLFINGLRPFHGASTPMPRNGKEPLFDFRSDKGGGPARQRQATRGQSGRFLTRSNGEESKDEENRRIGSARDDRPSDIATPSSVHGSFHLESARRGRKGVEGREEPEKSASLESR